MSCWILGGGAGACSGLDRYIASVLTAQFARSAYTGPTRSARKIHSAQSRRHQPTTPLSQTQAAPPSERLLPKRSRKLPDTEPRRLRQKAKPSPFPGTSEPTMPVFPSNKFQSKADLNTPGARYRSAIAKRPFLLFGLPFLAIIVAGSFVLTPATAVRYEKHDRKIRQLSKAEELDVRKNPRRVDWRDEYQVGFPWALAALGCSRLIRCAEAEGRQGPGRLAAEAS